MSFGKFFCVKISTALFKIIENCVKHCEKETLKRAKLTCKSHGYPITKKLNRTPVIGHLHYVIVCRLRDARRTNHDQEFCYRLRLVMVIGQVITKSILLITSMITDRIGRHKVLLPINHKNYNFRQKKKSQVMEDRENLH